MAFPVDSYSSLIGIGTKELELCRDWFQSYLDGLDYSRADLKKNLELKRDHTLRVQAEIIQLGSALDLGPDALRLAEILALFHDLGRFEQYLCYRTFVDRDSEDHAALSVKILKQNHLLDSFDPYSRDLIYQVIGWHNRFSIPGEADENQLFYCRLLRDADKLDIWHVVTDYYIKRQSGKKNPAIEMGLLDCELITPEVISALERGEMVNSGYLRSLNDFKLLQVGWIYGINYVPTLEAVQERGYLDLIRDQLPSTPRVDAVFDRLNGYLDSRLN